MNPVSTSHLRDGSKPTSVPKRSPSVLKSLRHLWAQDDQETGRSRHIEALSVNKATLLFCCTSLFYTAQVRHIHVPRQKVQCLLIKLKYVGWELQSASLARFSWERLTLPAPWPYITASLIIAACIYLQSYRFWHSFYIRNEVWAVRWPQTALVFFVFCHKGTAIPR